LGYRLEVGGINGPYNPIYIENTARVIAQSISQIISENIQAVEMQADMAVQV
jgi:hypothetical protein